MNEEAGINNVRFRIAGISAVLCVLAPALPILGAEATFGPSTTTISLTAASFTPQTSGDTYGVDTTTMGRYATAGLSISTLVAGLDLPSGAVLDQLAFEVYDNDPTADILVGSQPCGAMPAGGPCTLPAEITTSGQPGWTYLTLWPFSDPPIDNLSYARFLYVRLPVDGGLTLFRRVLVYYHLQVSPPPQVATFTDVPTDHPFFQFIEALHAAGVTAGCSSNPPMYCPDRALTRGELAVFLSKALGLFWPN